MHHVFYAGFCFDTSDALALAVARCSAELAAIGRLETVEIPAVYDGEVTRVTLVIGAGMPVAVSAFLGGTPHLAGVDEALARLEALTSTASGIV